MYHHFITSILFRDFVNQSYVFNTEDIMALINFCYVQRFRGFRGYKSMNLIFFKNRIFSASLIDSA